MIRTSELRLGSATAPGSNRVRNLRARRQRTRSVPLEILGITYFLLVVMAGSLLVLQPARVAQINEAIARSERELQSLKLKNEDLKKAVAYVESLDFVESEARGILGMVDPGDVKALEVPALRENPAIFASAEPKSEPSGILSLIGRIAQIFGVKEATAKGQR
jgi:cell division protein FtsB